MPASIVDLGDLNKPLTSADISLLLVEDEVIVAEDVRRRLEMLGYVVVGIANRGTEAIQMAIQHRPSLILMDIGLRGGMDGIETVRRIREKVDVPIVFASAYSDDATLKRARAAEPQGFVLKPFEERELRAAIEMAVHKHRAERQHRSLENLLRRVYDGLPGGVLVESPTRHVELANSAFYRLFKIAPTVQLVGEDAHSGLADHLKLIADFPTFLRRQDTIVQKGLPHANDPVHMTDGRTMLMSYTPLRDGESGVEHLWHFAESVPA
jgi:CheY-like chemotaxis protein